MFVSELCSIYTKHDAVHNIYIYIYFFRFRTNSYSLPVDESIKGLKKILLWNDVGNKLPYLFLSINNI